MLASPTAPCLVGCRPTTVLLTPALLWQTASRFRVTTALSNYEARELNSRGVYISQYTARRVEEATSSVFPRDHHWPQRRGGMIQVAARIASPAGRAAT